MPRKSEFTVQENYTYNHTSAVRWLVSKILPRVFDDKPEPDGPGGEPTTVVVCKWMDSPEDKLAADAERLEQQARQNGALPAPPVLRGVPDLQI